MLRPQTFVEDLFPNTLFWSSSVGLFLSLYLQHNKNNYGLGKPLIIAEFNQVRGGRHSIEQLFNYAYYHGYAGAWSWHANADGSDTDDFATQQRGMRYLNGKNDQNNGGLINLTI